MPCSCFGERVEAPGQVDMPAAVVVRALVAAATPRLSEHRVIALPKGIS